MLLRAYTVLRQRCIQSRKSGAQCCMKGYIGTFKKEGMKRARAKARRSSGVTRDMVQRVHTACRADSCSSAALEQKLKARTARLPFGTRRSAGRQGSAQARCRRVP